MRSIIAFISSKLFLFQLGIALLLFIGIYFGLVNWMESYTNKGVSVELPNIKGKNIDNARESLESLGLRIELIDSVFSEERQPGEVIKQIPDAFQKVKSNRTVYVVINSVQPPLVAIPNVINQSRRESVSTLEALGFKITEFEYQPDICTDCILQVMANGKPVRAGLKLPKGTGLKIVLGKGISEEFTDLPYFRGKTAEEAFVKALESTLKIGATIYEDCENAEDSAKAVVIRQNPEYEVANKQQLALGSEIDLWLSPDSSRLVLLPLDSLNVKPVLPSNSSSTDEDFSN